MKKDFIVLGIESSCDETSVAIVKNGREILCNIINSQIEIHKQFGGVVPEVASRNHIKNIDICYKLALKESGLCIDDIDAIAVTYGAGLMGALLVGVEFAKSLAYAAKKPLIDVSHISGHIAANYLTHSNLKPPFLCLLVSGGHTAILDVKDYCDYPLISTTLDDACGEAFDKVSRILGLGYPGGPVVEKCAERGNANIDFVPKGILKNSLNFSFSGLKTAVVNFVHKQKQNGIDICAEDVCASFQKAAVNELTEKTLQAAKNLNAKKIVIAGGVGANKMLSCTMQKLAAENNIECYFPKLSLCTDNAAMIASMAYYKYLKYGKTEVFDVNAKPTVSLV